MFREFHHLNKKDILKIIAVVALSDGTIRNKKEKYVRLVTKMNESQHELFKYLCLRLLNKEPNRCYPKYISGYTGKVESYIQSTINSKELVDDLLKLSPNYKTTPYADDIKIYLNSQQPTARFLFNESKSLKWLALRTWFDFDGSISPSFKLKNKKEKKNDKIYSYYQLQFEVELRISETNPSLIEDLRKICFDLGLNPIKKTNKSKWSGIEGIGISKLDAIKKFISKGGPITDVKIHKSKRFFGIEKKKLCLAVKKILDDKSIKKSVYFKDKEEALSYKDDMDKILFNTVNSI